MAVAKDAYHHGDLRAALLKAALETIEEIGPQGLTIREVARRAGVSHAAPYRHFTDKDELILAVVERGFDLLESSMEAAREAAGSDELLRFAASGEAYLDFALGYPTYYRVMFSGDLLNRKGKEALRHTSAATFKQMQADLVMAQRLGLVREGNPKLQAIAIVSAVHGFVSLANDNRISELTDGDTDLAAIKAFVLTSIFEGLGVR